MHAGAAYEEGTWCFHALSQVPISAHLHMLTSRSSLNSILLDFYGGFITGTCLTKSLAINSPFALSRGWKIEAESFNSLVT